MIIPKFPDQREIDAMIKNIERISLLKAVKKPENEAIKEAVDWIIIKMFDYYLINEPNPYFIPETEEELAKINNIYIEQLKPVDKLKSKQARSLAILCIDWLNGQNDGTWIKIKLK